MALPGQVVGLLRPAVGALALRPVGVPKAPRLRAEEVAQLAAPSQSRNGAVEVVQGLEGMVDLESTGRSRTGALGPPLGVRVVRASIYIFVLKSDYITDNKAWWASLEGWEWMARGGAGCNTWTGLSLKQQLNYEAEIVW